MSFLQFVKRITPFSLRLRVEVEVNRALAKGSRIVEIPFVIGTIDLRRPCKVLSFGSFNDLVSIELASLGFEVIGFDLNQSIFSHPKLKFVRGDFLETSASFKGQKFDLAYALSSLEHVGLETYGQALNEEGDKQVIDIIHELLRPGRKFIFTVPFGRSGKYPRKKATYRKYDRNSLNYLLSQFSDILLEFYGSDEFGNWSPILPEKLEMDESDVPRGVVCVKALKPD